MTPVTICSRSGEAYALVCLLSFLPCEQTEAEFLCWLYVSRITLLAISLFSLESVVCTNRTTVIKH